MCFDFCSGFVSSLVSGCFSRKMLSGTSYFGGSGGFKVGPYLIFV